MSKLVAKKYVIAIISFFYDKWTQILTENGVFHIFQGHLSYFHSKIAKLCTTDHQSCQEPETLSVGKFFSTKVVRPL